MNAPDNVLKNIQNLEILTSWKKTIHGYNNFESYIRDTLVETWDRTLIALSGIPGSGKSKMLDTLTENETILWEKWEPIVAYNTGIETTYKGYNHSLASAFHMEADWFFWALWNDRYTAMLENFDSFCKLYWDEETAIKVMRHFFEGTPGQINWVYGKTQSEKDEKLKKGNIVFVEPENEKRVIVLDGTNAIELSNRLIEETNSVKIDTIKILLTPSPEKSFMGILKRDILKHWKDAWTVVEFRLLEFFYIMKRWIVPALLDKDTIVFNPDHKPFDFDEAFVWHIMSLIQEKRNKLIQKIDDYETNEFIFLFSRKLLAYLSDKRFSFDTI